MGKWFIINNALDIPEVDNYKYLVIRLDQTLRLDGYKEELRRKENYILKRVKILKPSLVSIKSNLMTFKSVWKAQVSYGYSILSGRNKKYHDSWESIIYRILKGLFNTRVRISKKVLFKSLGFDEIEVYDIKYENLTIYQNKFISRLTNKSIKFRTDTLFRNFNKSPFLQMSIKSEQQTCRGVMTKDRVMEGKTGKENWEYLKPWPHWIPMTQFLKRTELRKVIGNHQRGHRRTLRMIFCEK